MWAPGTRPRKAALKEDQGHGFVRWSRTLCERPDSIRGAQRGPGRQQGELKFWGLKPRFSCSSALVLSKSSCTARSTAFPVEAESEEQSLGLFTAKQALRAQLSSLRPDHARDFTGHSAPNLGGPPAERDPNAQHQGGALKLAPRKRPEASVSFAGHVLHASGRIQFAAGSEVRAVSKSSSSFGV